MHIVVSRVIFCGTVMDVGCKTPGNHMLKVCVEGKKAFQYLKLKEKDEVKRWP